MGNVSIDLPPGFRFHPTDEEIITHYLSPKAMDPSFTTTAIGEVDLNKFEPWDLPNKAKMGEKEWYFFCQKDRKYPTGTRTNRATKAGYWKATGKDKEIFRGKGVLVGMKKTLVFYMGRAPKGEKTNWVMHEFRIEGNPSTNLPTIAQDEWVVSRVFHKKGLEMNMPMEASFISGGSSSYETSNIRDMEANANLFNNTLPYTSAVNPDFPLCEQQDLAAMEILAEANDESNFAVRRHCKGEQFSKQPTMLSPNTAEMSTDWYNHELDDPGSFAYPCIDFDNICNY